MRESQAEYELGVGLMGEHNVAGAFEHLQESVRMDPDNAEAHSALGTLFLFRGDHVRAEHHLREALRANAKLGGAGRPALNPEAHNTLGVVFMHQERFPEAEVEFRAAATDLINRTPHLAFGNLGWLYAQTHRLADAKVALAQAVASQPNFCLGWYRLASVQFEEYRADNTCTTCLGQSEESVNRALGNTDEACQAFQEAWSLRGHVRAQRGQHDESVADFERCVELGTASEVGQSCRNMLSGSDSTPTQ